MAKTTSAGDGKRVVGYIRASTGKQELGPEAQRASLEEWCRTQGATLVSVHEDRGVSGGTPIDRRPGLLAALDALQREGAGVRHFGGNGRVRLVRRWVGTMHLAIAQSAEAIDAVSALGSQAPVLALGFLAFGSLVVFFLRHLKEMATEARKERQESREAFSSTIREVSERAEAQAEKCHEVQVQAATTIRENSEALGAVRGALDRSMTVTQDLSQVLAAARAEIARSGR